MKSGVLGIAVPCFNESSRINVSYFEALASSENINLLFVNDGSTDNTLEILKSMSKNRNISILNLTSNLGKAEACRLGMKKLHELGHSERIGFLDADGAFSVGDVIRCERLSGSIFSEFSHVSSFWTSRVPLSGRTIHRSQVRNIFGRLLAQFIRLFIRGLPWDSQSGFKIFQVNEDLLSSLDSPFRTRWLFDIELFLRLKHSKRIVWEEPVQSWKDVSGSKIGIRSYKRIVLDLKILLELQLNIALKRKASN